MITQMQRTSSEPFRGQNRHMPLGCTVRNQSILHLLPRARPIRRRPVWGNAQVQIPHDLAALDGDLVGWRALREDRISTASRRRLFHCTLEWMGRWRCFRCCCTRCSSHAAAGRADSPAPGPGGRNRRGGTTRSPCSRHRERRADCHTKRPRCCWGRPRSGGRRRWCTRWKTGPLGGRPCACP